MDNLKVKLFLIILLVMVLTGCSSHSIKVTKRMNKVVSESIINHNKPLIKKGDHPFEVHKIYGAVRTKSGIDKVYVFYDYGEFSKSKSLQSGGLSPAVVTLKQENGKWRVSSYKEPRGGTLLVSSIKKLFPRNYAHEAIKDAAYDKANKTLEKQMKEKVREWFKVNHD